MNAIRPGRGRVRVRTGRRGAVAAAAAVAILLGLVSGSASAAPRSTPAADADVPAALPAPAGPGSVPAAQRAGVLGAGWRSSTDRAWTTSGDADGFHVLVADAASGYQWRTVATLSEPGLETDAWIGNACLTGSGRRAVVVYAPRTFTNRADLFDRGGFTAVVDLTSGAVRKLPVLTTLAYFSPACGSAEDAVLTQAGTEDLHRTRLIRVDAATGRLGAPIQVPGQLTSAVPTPHGIVAADDGALVRVGTDGSRRVLAPTAGVPFKLAPDADGGVVFMDRSGRDAAAVRRSTVPAGTARGAVSTLSTGALDRQDVVSGRGGRVFVTGDGRPAAGALPASVSRLAAPVGSRPSTQGRLVVTSVVRAQQPDPRVPVADPAAPQPVNIAATAVPTGRPVAFSVVPAVTGPSAAAGRALTPALKVATPRAAGPAVGPRVAAGDPNSPADFAERYCSVPRNDPANQAMQPKPRQVEWAIDQAVRGVLTVSRPANWKNLGMPAYTPQGLFGYQSLTGGGFIPAQVALGVAAQESNMWEAARFALPGVTANPLIGNYFGLQIYNADTSDDWTINWTNADCGYGVMQVTDGMRLAGHEKPGETAYAYQTQRAVGLDFAVNVAAGVRILAQKWNDTRAAGLVINNGDSSKIENWFYAVWAYNSGLHANAGNGTPWGVGWANNPANPRYPANRESFLDTPNTGYGDAAHPQDWSYPEKVMGWAGHPVEVPEAPDTPVVGYRAAWWNGGVADSDPSIDRLTPGSGAYNRRTVQPVPSQFCDATDTCQWGTANLPTAPGVIGEPAGPCEHKDSAGRFDLLCWYHGPSTWKADCSLTCGNELLRFDPGYVYQDDATSYAPNCTLAGLPAGAQIVDDVPDSTPVIRPNCGHPFSNAGTFTLNYQPDSTGQYPGKIDTHQIGAGFGGHFWFTHTRTSTEDGGKLKVTGTWQFNQTQNGYGRIYVHLPDHGAQTTIARYVVSTAYGDRVSVVSQPGTGNRWVSIGAWEFGNKPKVTLASVTPDGSGSQDVAFDAVAFVPLGGVHRLRILHWNMDGAKDNAGHDDVVKRLMAEVNTSQPDIIVVNEVCRRQFDLLNQLLQGASYQMSSFYHASQPIVPNCFSAFLPENRTSAGNAVYVRGTREAVNGYVFNDGGDPFAPTGVLQEREAVVGESRSIACITTKFTVAPTQSVKVCTAHLAQDQAGAEVQVHELDRVFGPQARAMPFILDGDMNIPTKDFADPAWAPNGALAQLYTAPLSMTDWSTSGEFDEVDQQNPCLIASPCDIKQGGPQTHDTGIKFDYTFASRWYFGIPVGVVSVNHDVGTCVDVGKPCSDHWLFHSEVDLPPSP